MTEVKSKGILFTAPMAGALLDGRKTMTRRLHGLDFVNRNPDDWKCTGIGQVTDERCRASFERISADGGVLLKPAYSPGDIVYVKENYRLGSYFDNRRPSQCEGVPVFYEADGMGDGPQVKQLR